MKRMLSLLLAAMLIFALAACGDKPAEPEDSSKPAPKPSATETLDDFSTDATIEETVLVDDGGVLITATGLTYTNYSVDLALSIENNTDQDLTFTSNTLGYSCNSVNGMMVPDGYMNCDVAAGKKAMDTISLGYEALQLYGIQEIADMEIGITASGDDFDSVDYAPGQIKTSAYEGYDYTKPRYQESIVSGAAQTTFGYEVLYFAADPLYEQNSVSLLSEVLMRNADGETLLGLEVENKSEDIRNVSVGDIAVNGLAVSGGTWDAETVAPGKRAVISVDLADVVDTPIQEAFGIDEIGSVSFALGQSDMDFNDVAKNETVTVNCGDTASVDEGGHEVYNANDVRIVSKTILPPDGDYDSDYHILLLAVNDGTAAVKLHLSGDSISVNGYMVDNYSDTWELQPGMGAVMELEVSEDDLEEIGVTEQSQITEVEFTLEINRGKTSLDEPTIKLDPSKK